MTSSFPPRPINTSSSTLRIHETLAHQPCRKKLKPFSPKLSLFSLKAIRFPLPYNLARHSAHRTFRKNFPLNTDNSTLYPTTPQGIKRTELSPKSSLFHDELVPVPPCQHEQHSSHTFTKQSALPTQTISPPRIHETRAHQPRRRKLKTFSPKTFSIFMVNSFPSRPANTNSAVLTLIKLTEERHKPFSPKLSLFSLKAIWFPLPYNPAKH